MEGSSRIMFIKAQNGILFNLDHVILIEQVVDGICVKLIDNKIGVLGVYNIKRVKKVKEELERKLEYSQCSFIVMPKE